jgi:hypothetical protein
LVALNGESDASAILGGLRSKEQRLRLSGKGQAAMKEGEGVNGFHGVVDAAVMKD